MYANAQYMRETFFNNITCIRVDINGVTSFVSIDAGNADYQNIMKLVEEGKLTIAPAETQ